MVCEAVAQVDLPFYGAAVSSAEVSVRTHW